MPSDGDAGMSIENEILPDLAALKRELWAIRFEMAEKIMEAEQRKHRNWSDEETQILKANLGKTDGQIARAMRKNGKKRSAQAVKAKRRSFEAAKRPPQERKSNGWPVVHGDFETQSERFRVALLEAMLAEHRAKRA